MRELGITPSQTMVDAFVRAELDSPRFGPIFHQVLSSNSISPDALWTEGAAHVRVQLLGAVRGYQRDSYLFRGFPRSVDWRIVELETADDWQKLKYANHDTWTKLSRGSRVVVDGAANVDKIRVEDNGRFINDSIVSIAERLRGGARFPELIAVEDSETGNFVLVEGHTRATAYVHARVLDPVRAIVGRAKTMASWIYF